MRFRKKWAQIRLRENDPNDEEAPELKLDIGTKKIPK